MPYNPFDPRYEDLPESVSIFPLEGVLLLPRGELPLNIFEPRYLAMVSDALKGSRLIGMIQPGYKTGCVGRVVRFEETSDGRYLVGLRGLCRFHLKENGSPAAGGYLTAAVDWSGFASDMVRVGCLDVDKENLKKLLRRYFESQGLSMDWELMDEVADEGLLTTLAMVCPFSSSEKQALLEAGCCRSRAGLFIRLLEMAVVNATCSSSSQN